eukprot:TRINITY_DN120688_c0_g1_i1.p1 TRINITY_DN120688_c0_g1~~TRINITY_DN120688_c0_g1_i1.p1  ORF type:complete len:363 (-),score=44.51 TRINITY_DN120688_c0_g1_i1:200-1237(-)
MDSAAEESTTSELSLCSSVASGDLFPYAFSAPIPRRALKLLFGRSRPGVLYVRMGEVVSRVSSITSRITPAGRLYKVYHGENGEKTLDPAPIHVVKALLLTSCGRYEGRHVLCEEKALDALRGLGVMLAVPCSPDLQCTICLSPYFEGVILDSCGHCFHAPCLEPVLQSTKVCPICRKSFARAECKRITVVQTARFLQNSLDDLLVGCPFEACGAEVRWQSLKRHVVRDCSHPTLICKYKGCFVTGTRTSIAEHEKMCGQACIICSCGEKVRRGLLEQHKAKVCTMQCLTCEFCHQEGILRCHMEAHLDECQGVVTMKMLRREVREVKLALEARLLALERKLRRR